MFGIAQPAWAKKDASKKAAEPVCHLGEAKSVDYQEDGGEPHLKISFTRTNSNQHFSLVPEIHDKKYKEYWVYYFVKCEYEEGTQDVKEMERTYDLPFKGSKGFQINTKNKEQKFP
jgi:hypothetical protein